MGRSVKVMGASYEQMETKTGSTAQCVFVTEIKDALVAVNMAVNGCS